MSTAKEIQESLSQLDVSNVERQSIVKTKPTSDCLVVKLDNELELKFIKSLCTSDKSNALNIELWSQVNNYLQPIGDFEMSFKNVQKIHSYNPNIKIGLYSKEPNKIFRLSVAEELCLP